MVSLLVAEGLDGSLTEDQCPEYFHDNPENLAQSTVCPDQFVSLAVATSLMVGAIQLLGGVLRLGFLVTFLGHPVVSGFTSGAAIIIGLSQFKFIMGYDIPKSQYVYVTLEALFSNISETKFMTVLLGGASLVALFLLREYLPRKNPQRFGFGKPLGNTMCECLCSCCGGVEHMCVRVIHFK